MCPNWNSWLEWCGNDPNLLKHGSGDSQLLQDISQVGDGLEIDSSSEGEGTDVVDGEGYETYAALTAARLGLGDEGHVGTEGDDYIAPRAITVRVAAAAGGDESAVDQARKRKVMLAGMNPVQKKAFYSQEAKEKREKEKEESEQRRSSIVAAASASSLSSPSSSSGSPFGKAAQSKDWQANFLVQHKHDQDMRSERQEASQVAIAKLQIEAADRHNEQELKHNQDLLSFSQMQFQSHQTQLQMQMQFEQQKQMM